MENPLLNLIVAIATGSTVVEVALFEWEGIMHAWSRVRRCGRRSRARENGMDRTATRMRRT
jgi:hypothetical protein